MPRTNTFRLIYRSQHGKKYDYKGEAATGAELIALVKSKLELLELGMAAEARLEGIYTGQAPEEVQSEPAPIRMAK